MVRRRSQLRSLERTDRQGNAEDRKRTSRVVDVVTVSGPVLPVRLLRVLGRPARGRTVGRRGRRRTVSVGRRGRGSFASGLRRSLLLLSVGGLLLSLRCADREEMRVDRSARAEVANWKRGPDETYVVGGSGGGLLLLLASVASLALAAVAALGVGVASLCPLGSNDEEEVVGEELGALDHGVFGSAERVSSEGGDVSGARTADRESYSFSRVPQGNETVLTRSRCASSHLPPCLCPARRSRTPGP